MLPKVSLLKKMYTTHRDTYLLATGRASVYLLANTGHHLASSLHMSPT